MIFFSATVFEEFDATKIFTESRATGTDKISAKTLKLIRVAIPYPVTKVTSVSMRAGKCPQLLKKLQFSTHYIKKR